MDFKEDIIFAYTITSAVVLVFKICYIGLL